MTETVTGEETRPADLGAQFEAWAEAPPPSVSTALREQGVDAEALETYIRSGISTEQAEALRKVLVQAAASENADDAALLARLTPLLDPRERAWDRVLRAKSSGEVLTATVTEATKGGVVVDLGVRGFVPASQIGLSVPRNLTQFVGRPLRLRVLEVDRRRQTVILTNRQVQEEERAAKRRGAIERLEEGEVRSGTVRRLTDIGAFVDVGGVDGLLHVSEIAWKRIEHPSDVLKVGQKIDVKVLRVDPNAGRVSLSMRRLTTDPWEEARRKFMPGMTVHAKVASVIQQGAVLELEGGLEGFLPVSELAHRRVENPNEVVQPGQEIDALLIEFNPRDRRVVLSLKKLEQRRERQVVESYQKKARQASSSDRTTLGDLFGHLFEEYQRQEPAEEPAPDSNGAAPQEPEKPAPALAQDESGVAVAAVATDDGAVAAVGANEVAADEGVGDEASTEAGEGEAAAAVGALEEAGTEPEAVAEDTLTAPDEAAASDEAAAPDAVGAVEAAAEPAEEDEAAGAEEPTAEAAAEEADEEDRPGTGPSESAA